MKSTPIVPLRKLPALLAALGGVANLFAAEAPPEELPTVYVSALAVREDASNVASPFSLIDATDLFEGGATTLGDALGRLPGVHSESFGGGSTRPVIRGQAPPRVSVLTDGATLFDASSVSPDHAVTAEPLLARRIEVLRGPATLLYGSGAIGGVVNVLDHRVPEFPPEKAFAGALALRGNSATQERSAALELDGRLPGDWALHLEAFGRDTSDYRVPRFRPQQAAQRIPGTFADADGGSVGVSRSGGWGYLGLAWSWRADQYGLPGHEHHFDACTAVGATLDCGEEEHEEEEEEPPPFVDLSSRRIDLRGALLEPLPYVSRLRLRASHTDYQHREIEEDVVATVFTNEGHELRAEAEHVPFGRWVGVVGLQHSDVDTGAIGAEAFVPVARQRSTGLFVVEHFEINDRWHLELGARHDWQRFEPVDPADPRPDYRDTALSLSAATVWELPGDYRLSLSAARSERLPYAQELYASGIHLATNTWECGLLDDAYTCGGGANDAPVGREVSTNVELLLRRTAGRLTFSLGAFHNDVDGYVYARTLDRFEDFRLIKYTARDARFAGVEAEGEWKLNDWLTAGLFGDRVRATLAGGGNLPRISPARIGARLAAQATRFGAELELIHVTRQTHVADYEEPTPGYDLVNLAFSLRPATGDRLTLFVRGANLLDEAVQNHTSFLANRVPLPGRSASAGIRLTF